MTNSELHARTAVIINRSKTPMGLIPIIEECEEIDVRPIVVTFRAVGAAVATRAQVIPLSMNAAAVLGDDVVQRMISRRDEIAREKKVMPKPAPESAVKSTWKPTLREKGQSLQMANRTKRLITKNSEAKNALAECSYVVAREATLASVAVMLHHEFPQAWPVLGAVGLQQVEFDLRESNIN